MYLPAETSKWTKVDAFLVPFIYFLLFFSYTPIYLLLCNYPIFTKQPVLSAIMLFLPFFWPLFYTFYTQFATPSHVKNDPPNPLSCHSQSDGNPSPARTRGHRRPPPTSFILILGLTCERPLHLPKMGFWVCVYRYWKNSSLFPIIRPRLRHDLQMQSFHAV